MAAERHISAGIGNSGNPGDAVDFNGRSGDASAAIDNIDASRASSDIISNAAGEDQIDNQRLSAYAQSGFNHAQKSSNYIYEGVRPSSIQEHNRREFLKRGWADAQNKSVGMMNMQAEIAQLKAANSSVQAQLRDALQTIDRMCTENSRRDDEIAWLKTEFSKVRYSKNVVEQYQAGLDQQPSQPNPHQNTMTPVRASKRPYNSTIIPEESQNSDTVTRGLRGDMMAPVKTPRRQGEQVTPGMKPVARQLFRQNGQAVSTRDGASPSSNTPTSSRRLLPATPIVPSQQDDEPTLAPPMVTQDQWMTPKTEQELHFMGWLEKVAINTAKKRIRSGNATKIFNDMTDADPSTRTYALKNWCMHAIEKNGPEIERMYKNEHPDWWEKKLGNEAAQTDTQTISQNNTTNGPDHTLHPDSQNANTLKNTAANAQSITPQASNTGAATTRIEAQLPQAQHSHEDALVALQHIENMRRTTIANLLTTPPNAFQSTPWTAGPGEAIIPETQGLTNTQPEHDNHLEQSQHFDLEHHEHTHTDPMLSTEQYNQLHDFVHGDHDDLQEPLSPLYEPINFGDVFARQFQELTDPTHPNYRGPYPSLAHNTQPQNPLLDPQLQSNPSGSFEFQGGTYAPATSYEPDIPAATQHNALSPTPQSPTHTTPQPSSSHTSPLAPNPPLPPPSRISRATAPNNVPDGLYRGTVCADCHANWWNTWCDATPQGCYNCRATSKVCRRPQCDNFFGECVDPACKWAHRGDGYVDTFPKPKAGVRRRGKKGDHHATPPRRVAREMGMEV